MATSRELPDDFLYFLKRKDPALVDTFIDLRSYVISIYPESNELLYHTHALTAVYSVSDKLAEGFCHIPIYTEHLNLGFNKGTLVDDPQHLLQGTGKLIRHIPINSRQDYRNEDVRNLIINAVEFEMEDLDDESRINWPDYFENKGSTIKNEFRHPNEREIDSQVLRNHLVGR